MNVNPKGSGAEASFREHRQCRVCGSGRLCEFINLGEQPLANSFLSEKELEKPEPRYPLRVFWCRDCGLSQLGEVVSAEALFRHYVYFSSGMPSSLYYRNYARDIVKRFLGGSRGLTVEIGSNDGHLLGEIQSLGARVLGVDPAQNIAKLANDRGIPTLPEFFSKELAGKIRDQHGEARLVIGNNVVAHIDDHHDLVRGVKALLADKGVFVFEAPYLTDMFENLAFDSIYHEHLSYLSLRPLLRLFEKYGMEIFDAKVTEVQGNSIRMYAAKKDAYPLEESVVRLLAREEGLGLASWESYLNLSRRIEGLKSEMKVLLSGLKRQGKRLACYGAPARGNTLLNYLGIGRDTLEYATEELSSKIGIYTPGVRIPVISVEEARRNPPDYYLLLAWPYQKAVLEKEKEFRQKGGKFILPVGNVRIV